tara:strand:- start:569 stop:772 length:204 start_codon:yes stop_codon:yes gene_type:complete
MSFASGCIVLNFIHLKETLFLPILSCKKNIGPLELSFISKEINRNNGEKVIKNNIENKKSNIFFIKL